MTEAGRNAQASDVGVAVVEHEPDGTVLKATERMRHRLIFNDKRQREEHVAAFMAWLHPALRCAPEIDWTALPSPVMGYLMNTTSGTVDVLPVTQAVGCARAAMDARSLLTATQAVTTLLRRMRAEGVVTELGDLRERATWDAFAQRVGLSSSAERGGRRSAGAGFVMYMSRYQALAGTHQRDYINDTLTPERGAKWPRAIDALGLEPAPRWGDFVLPPMPHKYLDRTGIRGRDIARERAARKEDTEVLAPLHPVLVQIALLRKQAVDRLVHACRTACAQVGEAGVKLPISFTHRARIPELNQDARTVAAIEITDREVDLHLTLWDRHTWVEAHRDRLTSINALSECERRTGAYAPARNAPFVQCHNPPEDLLWFGHILAGRLVGRISNGEKTARQTTQARRAAAEALGEPGGFHLATPGLLKFDMSMAQWLRANVRPDEIVFDPESLRRGVLYATALAVVALTSGARVSELLQISGRRYEILQVDEVRAGKKTGKRVDIVVQKLLPKGCTQEEERQFFLIAPQACPLLLEITAGLEAAHDGTIPIIEPRYNAKEEHLEAEPYLFQWSAGPDGHTGLLRPSEVPPLLRFLFHGLTFTRFRTGEPIRIVTHLCRHVAATAAHTEYHVPPEAIAYLLHHRMGGDRASRPGLPTIPEATRYYSEPPVGERLTLLNAMQTELARRGTQPPLRPPTDSALDEMDESLRRTFEEWGTVGPVAFGFCKAGMCVRPGNRALCVGCPHLVVHFQNLDIALAWRRLYERNIAFLEARGLGTEVRQQRRALEQLDGHIAVMRMQVRVLQDGGALPSFLSLPHPAEPGFTDALRSLWHAVEEGEPAAVVEAPAPGAEDGTHG